MANADFYDRDSRSRRQAGNIAGFVAATADRAARLCRWRGLIKAAFTFEGGASYAAWKIERHSGRKITLSPWQRRHPVLAGLLLLPQLLWRGAIK